MEKEKGRKCVEHKVPTRWEDQVKRLDKIIDNQHAIMMIVLFVYYMQVDVRDLRTGICLPSQWVDQSSNNNLVACKLQHMDGFNAKVTK